MKYYLIQSFLVGNNTFFWNAKEQKFGFEVNATIYRSMQKAQKEVEQNASFHEPCHVIELNEHRNN
jgi:hypothetical protein